MQTQTHTATPAPTYEMDANTFSAAFFYVDGIPTKGRWFNLDEDFIPELVETLLKIKFPDCSTDEILVADAQGFADYFHSCQSFDWDGWETFKEELQLTNLDHEVIMAYFENCGQTDIDTIEEAYQGQHNSDEDFAYQLADEIGLLDGMDESLQCYFDWESWARDLMMCDYFESNGHYFRNM